MIEKKEERTERRESHAKREYKRARENRSQRLLFLVAFFLELAFSLAQTSKTIVLSKLPKVFFPLSVKEQTLSPVMYVIC